MKSLGRFARLALAATWAFLALGAFLMVLGGASVPLTGWGGA